MNILHVCLTHPSDLATLPWEIQKKPFSTVLLASRSVHLFLVSSSCDQLIHTSDYLQYLRRKQTVTHLPTRLKMSPQCRATAIPAAYHTRCTPRKERKQQKAGKKCRKWEDKGGGGSGKE